MHPFLFCGFADTSGLQLFSLALLSYPWFIRRVIELFTVILRLFYRVHYRGTGGLCISCQFLSKLFSSEHPSDLAVRVNWRHAAKETKVPRQHA